MFYRRYYSRLIDRNIEVLAVSSGKAGHMQILQAVHAFISHFFYITIRSFLYQDLS